MSRFGFDLADKDDDAELRCRMAEDCLPGNISVSFRREPSYFSGSRVQGDTVQVIKCTDLSTRRIIGLGGRALSQAWVNGRPQRIGYLADLRAHPGYRGGTLLARGYRYFHELHQADPVALYYTMILEGNGLAQRILTSGRCGLPHYRDMGRILTPAIHLDIPKRAIHLSGVRFTRAKAEQLADILRFVQQWQSQKQLAPIYCDSDFNNGRLQGLSAQDIYIALRDDRIIGVIAAWDQRAFRQTHVERYSTPLRFMRPLYNVFAQVTPLKPLPSPGAMVPYFYLALVAVENNDPVIFRALLRYLYRERRLGRWHYFIAGLHERDPLAPILKEYRHIHAAGHLYAVHYPEDEMAFRQLDDRIPYIEIGSV